MKKNVISSIMIACTAMAGTVGNAQSPYISRVYEYRPAPGQFINELSEYEPGDTQEDMNRKAEEQIAGEHHNEGMISLGGYGGYAVFGFDHPVENIPGRYDFRILGNAFYANDNPNGEASREGGSCEPGIVMVSRDVNGNGLPDDPWYELAGSEYNRPQTIHNYRITYYKPDENKTPDPDPDYPDINDRTYIRWTTNGHGDGYLYRNTYHPQPYYPLWVESDTLSFEGTKLADNYVDESGHGHYYVLYACHWGYADNRPNTDNRSAFSIEWAVDAGGNRVSLPDINFVKVYTGVNQYCGWLGETSTEISGAIDLHIAGGDAAVPVFVSDIELDRYSAELQPGETLTLTATVIPDNAVNKAVTWKSLAPDVAGVNAAGVVTAHTEGSAVIRAIANDGYYIAECHITVEMYVPQPVTVTGVSLDRTALSLEKGARATLTATVEPADAANRSVVWSSSDTDVAEVTVTGQVIAFAAGTAVITAKTVDGGFTADCNLTVSYPAGTQALGECAPPQAFYAAGALYLRNLEGYACTVFSVTGQSLRTFRPASSDERRLCFLPPGVYILVAPGFTRLIKINGN